MALNVLLISLIFVVSLAVAVTRGIRPVFVWIYLPALLLLYQVAPVILTHVPLETYFAPLYACLIAMPFRQEPARFKPNWIDLVVVLLVVSASVTGLLTEGFEILVNTFRNEALRLAVPYFLARIVFKDWQPRRQAIYMIGTIMSAVTVCALVEFRLVPQFYQHLLQTAGMNNTIFPDVLRRWGYNRVTGTVDQPIYFGNMCLVLAGMIVVLARTSGLRLRHPVVVVTLTTTLLCLALSMSFTPMMGLLCGSAALVGLMVVPAARRLVFTATVAGVLAGFAYTWYVAATTHAGDIQVHGNETATAIEGSYNMRNEIIRQSWPIAQRAGLFGFGQHTDFLNLDNFDLLSVDNTYLYFTMIRGWVYTALWTSISLLFAARAGRAFARVTDRSQLLPLAACTATVLGLMVSMYTVFAGALYTIVWIVMLGLSNTLFDTVHAAAEARAGLAGAAAQAAAGRLRPPTVRLPGVRVAGAR